MSKEYPLFPELPEAGAQAAQALIDRFKEQMRKAADEVLGDLYINIVPHIESDSWTNYRNAMMEGFRNYSNRLVQGEHDFKAIRAEIFKDFREDIIKDLDQDNLKKIESLEHEIKHDRELRRGRDGVW